MEQIKEVAESLDKIKLEDLIASVLILVIGIVLVKVLDHFLRKIFAKTQIDERIKRLVLGIGKIILYITVIIVSLSTLGINMNAIVAVITIASLGVTLALENLISNMASGIMLITTKPFTVGQYIESEDKGGTVKAIHLNNTEIEMPDGATVIVPNNTLANSIITNFYASGQRRLEFTVSCAYGEPTEKVKKGFLCACQRFKEIMSDPPPEIYVKEMKNWDIEYVMYVWTKSDEAIPVKYGFMTALRDELEKHEVVFAYPHVDVNMIGKKN